MPVPRKNGSNYIPNFQLSLILNWKDSKMEYLIMKKVIFAILLIAIVTAACTCGSSSCGSTSTCGSCSCGCGTGPVVTSPPIVVPECLVPQVECPQSCPPPSCTPEINCPEIEVSSMEVPTVCPPPTIVVPEVIIPEANVCEPVAPSAPYQPTPTLPGMPTYNPPTIPLPPAPQAPLTNKFFLTFSWACRKNVAFSSCLGNIVWNDVIVASIVPNDYNVHTQTIVVYVKPGQNKLQIEGAGTEDSYGLTVDNVILKRDGTSVNIVVNGNFEQPDVGYSWGIFNNVPGWEGAGIQIGWGKIYNAGWNSQVIELDGRKNTQITQKWNFDSSNALIAFVQCDDKIFSNKSVLFKLQFNYAARKNGVSSPHTSWGNVLWNNIIIGSLSPTDYSVQTATFWVAVQAGSNVLQFEGTSHSDGYGLNVDNVKLSSNYNNWQNLVLNGGFENPSTGSGWSYFAGGIPNWKAQKAEVGKCNTIYNSNWPASSGQCIQLDSDSNQRYTQVISVNSITLTQWVINKVTIEGQSAIASQLSCAENAAQAKIDSAVAKLEGDIDCKILMLKDQFDKYICKLYNAAESHVQCATSVLLYKYDCLSSTYISHYGSASDADFGCQCFDGNYETGECHIDQIHGHNIHCHDHSGQKHHLQVAPCSHFEGTFPVPQKGKKIHWKGKKQPCGKTYVRWATTCDC